MNLTSLLNFLPLLLGGNFKNILENESVIKPILKGFGLPEETLENLLPLAKKILGGEMQLKDLLPIIIPVVTAFLSNTKENAPEKTSEAFSSYVKLEPVESFADEQIYTSLNGYFDAETAL